MQAIIYCSKPGNRARAAAVTWLISLWLAAIPEVVDAARLATVPKWHRFEQAFRSSVAYTHPLQEVTLTVRFVSPLGDSYAVFGFWDGDKTWRVRFAPDQPGEWHYQTSCSDAGNRGLNGQAGVFLCTAALGPSRFEQHGPIRIARDHHHLEHADGTPFFWLADTVWNGARVSDPKDWELYAQVRASQGFTVAQWAAAPGADFKQDSALTGFPDRVGVNPEVFRRLDAKLETLSQVGILSAIVPLFELRTNAMSLREDQAALVIKYVVARWGAEPAMWLLPFDGLRAMPPSFSRWEETARSGFAEGWHSPVVAFCGDKTSLLGLLEGAKWADVFGFKPVMNMSAESLRVTFEGAPQHMPANEPARPWLVFTPYENALVHETVIPEGAPWKSKPTTPPAETAEPGPAARFNAEDVRRAAYWGLLTKPPAGVSYGSQGVMNWDQTTDNPKEKTSGANLPMWQKALFMPGAKQMARLGNFFSSIDFWRLRPDPRAVAKQPGVDDFKREVLAVGTETKDLVLVYVPEDRTLELYLEAMPASPTVTWFNPRTGDTSPAVAVVVGRTCQFPTPEPGDWLLMLKAGK